MKKLAMWVGLIIFCIIALPAFGQQTGVDFVQPKAEEYFSKGVGLHETQNYNEAIAAFEKAIEIKPDYAEAYYNLALTYWQQEQYGKVSENLQKVMELAPGSDVAKKAAQNIENLKTAGVYLVKPKEEKEEKEEVSVRTEPSEKPTATLPELIEDLRFGPTSKRIAAAKSLGFFPEEEAVKALGEVTENSGELPEIRMAAVESLGKIDLPSTTPFLQTAREGFADILRPAYLQATGERKITMALALGRLKDTIGVPLMVSRLKEDYSDDASSPKSSLNQPPSPRAPGMPGPREITPPPSGIFNVPSGISNVPSGTPGSQRIMPPSGVFYRPGPGGIMPGSRKVTPASETPGIKTGPSIIPILKEQTTESEGWSRKDEIVLRMEIVEVLGICAGSNQKPFLVYLSKNDPEKKVKEAALKAVQNLESRIASSIETYQKGTALVKEGKITEAIPLIQTALKENPDAPYAEEIKKLQARFNYDRALVLLKENKKEEAITLLQSALELDPGATFQKDAEDKLAELQVSTSLPPKTAGIPPKPGLIPGSWGRNMPPPGVFNLPGGTLPAGARKK